MRARTGATLATAVASLFVLAQSSHADTAPALNPTALVVTDPAGDEQASQSGDDITAVTFDTTGTTVTVKKNGKTKKIYTPDKLVVSVTMAAPVATTPVTDMYLGFRIAGCADSESFVEYTPGSAGLPLGETGYTGFGCGSAPDNLGSTATTAFMAPTITGNTLSWSFALKSLPKEVKLGAAFSGIYAYTSVSDPTGDDLVTVADQPPVSQGKTVAIDWASTDKTWKLA